MLTGIPGQDGRRLHPGPGDRGVPVGHADHHPERDQRHRRGDRSRVGERGAGLHRAGPNGAGLPARQRREGLGGRRLQSPDQHHVHAVAERLRADAGQYLRRRGGQPALCEPCEFDDRPHVWVSSSDCGGAGAISREDSRPIRLVRALPGGRSSVPGVRGGSITRRTVGNALVRTNVYSPWGK